MADNWSLTETAFDPATARAWEGLFTLGSGYLHVRGSLEEHLSGAPQNADYVRRPGNTTAERFPEFKQRWGTFVPGLFGLHPLLGPEMVNLPWFLGLAPTVAGERLDAEKGRISGWRRTLDMKRALLERRLTWHPAAGPRLEVAFERFVSAARPHLVVQRMTLQAEQATPVHVASRIEADVRTNGHDHFADVALGPAHADGTRCRVRTDAGDEVEVVSRLVRPQADWKYEPAYRAGGRTGDLVVSPGAALVVEKRTAIATSRDLDPADPEGVLRQADPLSWDDLLAEHAAVWQARWDASDVLVEGDEESQAALRASIYHLLRALVRGDARVAIEAKGFAGEAYRGHFFWDTEMYLLPFYLYTDPAAARSLVDFRVRTLPAARRLAAQYGYPGARYPWESDSEGRECCQQWQYAAHQVHVTADVVYGFAHYSRATGGEASLREGAAEAVVETARYWLARLDRRPGDAHPSLLGVMGPDEYKPIVSNNAYTNRLVSFALEVAARVGAAGGASDAECRAFADAAAALPLLRRADGLVLQCEEFERLARPPFDEFWTDRAQPFARFVSPERLYRTRCLKQADVLMLMMLFPEEFTDQEVRQAWDYYLPLTTHDSSLSASVHAIVASRLGLEEAAWTFWKSSAGLDLRVEHGGAAEGVHIAAAGGNWMAAVLGFAGMRTALQADVLTLRPRLPKAWRRLDFPLVWKGVPVHVDITPGATTVTNRGTAPLEACVSGRTQTVAPGAAATFAAAGPPQGGPSAASRPVP